MRFYPNVTTATVSIETITTRGVIPDNQFQLTVPMRKPKNNLYIYFDTVDI